MFGLFEHYIENTFNSILGFGTGVLTFHIEDELQKYQLKKRVKETNLQS